MVSSWAFWREASWQKAIVCGEKKDHGEEMERTPIAAKKSHENRKVLEMNRFMQRSVRVLLISPEKMLLPADRRIAGPLFPPEIF
jgi:hypothetical protein